MEVIFWKTRQTNNAADMKQKRVNQILLPLKTGIPEHPAISLSDKITRAVEVMLTHNINQIVVCHHNRPIGMVRLEDAFQKLGLQVVSGTDLRM